MKNFLFTIVICISLILLHSCAKPTVVNVVMPEDEKLNCPPCNSSNSDSPSTTGREDLEAEIVEDETYLNCP